MRQGFRLPSPALVVSALALFVAMGGTVYAAKKAKKVRIDGKAVRVKSLPGNRVKPRSIPANRLKGGVLASLEAGQRKLEGDQRRLDADRQQQIVGSEIDTLTLSQVPEAAHAESADTAKSATDAETALNAVNAITAQSINGHTAGCEPGTEEFAGACWQKSSSESAVSAPAAANSCAVQGGAVPEALQLASFSQQPGITLASGDEWSSDVTNMSDENIFAVVTVSASADFNYTSHGNSRKYRCVLPLVH